MFPQYTIVSFRTHESFKFDSSHAAALFMWGRDIKDYYIFKTKKIEAPPCLTRLQQLLEEA